MRILIVLLFLTLPLQAQQTEPYSPLAVAQLIEIRHGFSSYFTMKALDRHHAFDSPVRLEAVRVEPMSASRYSVSGGRVGIDFRNLHTSKTIASTDWKIDIYDQQRRTLTDTFYVGGKKQAAPKQKAGVGSEMGNLRLPYSPAALAQIVKITYTDGSTWEPQETCQTNSNITAIQCEKK